jgi:hypothetical protein
MYHTMFSDLEQRCLDAEWDDAYPESGLLKKTQVKGRDYWYFQERIEGKYKKRYVGPDGDPEISSRIKRFKTIKDDFTARRKLVSTLVNDAGLPRSEMGAGDVVEALWKAGLFRMRAVIVGSVAFETYAGLLGVRLPSAVMRTGDVDVAQFHSISVSVNDSLPDMLGVLQSVDPSFAEIPHRADGRFATRFIARDSKLSVDFLTPNYSKDDYSERPAIMPSLGGASAQPLRFLDFLIAEPTRSLLMHKGGIPVRVPTPERYAVHKLIVSTRRREAGQPLPDVTEVETVSLFSKREKDIRQAGILIEALTLRRHGLDLASAWVEAWQRGPAWREGLIGGRAALEPEQRELLEKAIIASASDLKFSPVDVGF